MPRIAVIGMLAVFVLLLAGCKSTYEVSFRNNADQPITAQIRSGNPKGNSTTLASTRVPPGDRETIIAEGVRRLKRVFVSVDFEGNTGLAETARIKRGMTGVNVRREDEGSEGTITLELIRP